MRFIFMTKSFTKTTDLFLDKYFETILYLFAEFLISATTTSQIAHFHLFPFHSLSLFFGFCSFQLKWASIRCVYIYKYLNERLHFENRCAEKFHIIFFSLLILSEQIGLREHDFSNVTCMHACVRACESFMWI